MGSMSSLRMMSKKADSVHHAMFTRYHLVCSSFFFLVRVRACRDSCHQLFFPHIYVENALMNTKTTELKKHLLNEVLPTCRSKVWGRRES